MRDKRSEAAAARRDLAIERQIDGVTVQQRVSFKHE